MGSNEYQIGILNLAAIRKVGDLVSCTDDNTKIHSRASETPEEIGIFGRRCCDDVAGGRDQSDTKQIVEYQAVYTLIAANTSPHGSTDNAYACARAGCFTSVNIK